MVDISGTALRVFITETGNSSNQHRPVEDWTLEGVVDSVEPQSVPTEAKQGNNVDLGTPIEINNDRDGTTKEKVQDFGSPHTGEEASNLICEDVVEGDNFVVEETYINKDLEQIPQVDIDGEQNHCDSKISSYQMGETQSVNTSVVPCHEINKDIKWIPRDNSVSSVILDSKSTSSSRILENPVTQVPRLKAPQKRARCC